MTPKIYRLTISIVCIFLVVCSVVPTHLLQSEEPEEDQNAFLHATPEHPERDSCNVSNIFETCDNECGECETCGTLDYVQVDIESERGIGNAWLSRILPDEASDDETPSFAIRFILHMRGLEGFSLASEDAKFRLQVPSSNPHMRLVSIIEVDENAPHGFRETRIGPDNVRYPSVRVFNADDEELTDKLPGRGGRFEVTLPPPLVDEFLTPNARLQWFDFYR